MAGVSDLPPPLTPQQISIFQQASKAPDVKRGKLHTLSCWLNVKLKKWETADDVLKGISSGAIDFQDLRKMKSELVHKVAEAIPKIVKDQGNQGEVAVNLRMKLITDQAAILSTIKKVLDAKDKNQIPLAKDLADIYQQSSGHIAKERVEERGLAKDIIPFMQVTEPGSKLTSEQLYRLNTASLNELLGTFVSCQNEKDLEVVAKTVVNNIFGKKAGFEAIDISDIRPKLKDIAKEDEELQKKLIETFEKIWQAREKEHLASLYPEKIPIKGPEKASMKTEQPIDLDTDDWFNKGSKL